LKSQGKTTKKILFYLKPHFSLNNGQLAKYSLHACVGYSLFRFRNTTPHVSVSSFVYSTCGIGSPLNNIIKTVRTIPVRLTCGTRNNCCY